MLALTRLQQRNRRSPSISNKIACAAAGRPPVVITLPTVGAEYRCCDGILYRDGERVVREGRD